MISIVIPALNEEKYLPDCLMSLKNQDWPGDREIIVVDNGSTDRTASVAAAHGVKVVNCSRKGVAYARQAGAEQARGDIIVQVDADTVYPRRWLSQIAGHFAAHPHSAAVAGRYEYAEPAGWAPIENVCRKLLNHVGSRFFHRPLWVSGANFAFQRTAFVRAQGYDPVSFQPDQWGIARRLSQFGPVHYDADSVVKTSSRRVAKPLYIIGLEVIRNCARAGLYFLRHVAGQVRKPFRRQEVP